ncbi:hypothetical protein BWI75_18180 [Gloeocapsopsis sp. AAB1 = 1H9]|uniref:Uncharacterized protein n=1 Tax=Gloeocapsopsis dulcis AAB1 = 1H9 TaxID=1433147 RepID=A0A6N8FZP1_9CHRO|nr:hypothetical protein [Gloeocapsopsis dulcis AAB1 = 1H9]
MKVLLKSSMQSPLRLLNGGSLRKTSTTSGQVKGAHTCPCCSETLLRHLGAGKLFWRCSHCYQEMPV